MVPPVVLNQLLLLCVAEAPALDFIRAFITRHCFFLCNWLSLLWPSWGWRLWLCFTSLSKLVPCIQEVLILFLFNERTHKREQTTENTIWFEGLLKVIYFEKSRIYTCPKGSRQWNMCIAFSFLQSPLWSLLLIFITQISPLLDFCHPHATLQDSLQVSPIVWRKTLPCGCNKKTELGWWRLQQFKGYSQNIDQLCGWPYAKGQKHLPQDRVRRSAFVRCTALSYLFIARRLILNWCISEWRDPDVAC